MIDLKEEEKKMKLTMENVIKAVKREDQSAIVDEYSEIQQLHTWVSGWVYCGKMLKDIAEFANYMPAFYEKVDAVKINGKEYKL